MTEKALVPRSEPPFALPATAEVQSELQAVRNFQELAQKLLVQGHDYGIIPGTQKPTLLKPGAEKIAKLLRLADTYEIISKVEDWEKGLFAYEVRAILSVIGTPHVVSTGLGECNSHESKYRYRWLFQSQLPSHLQDEKGKAERDKMVQKPIKAKGVWTKLYRVENDNLADVKNTILKMAKKRALVDAALSAGRLSDIFTQDLEDSREMVIENEVPGPAPTPTPTQADAHRAQVDADELFGAEAKEVGRKAAGPVLSTAIKENGVLASSSGQPFPPPEQTGPPKMPQVQNWGEMAAAINALHIATSSILVRAGVKSLQELTETYGVEGGYKKAWEIALELKKEKGV